MDDIPFLNDIVSAPSCVSTNQGWDDGYVEVCVGSPRNDIVRRIPY